MSAMTRGIRLISLCFFVLIPGCHQAGTVPPGWRGEPYAFDALDTNNPPAPSAGTLQVFICYGKVLSNHTALRLEAPGLNTLMWDPGGTFKQDDPAYARRYDVLTRKNLTVEQWWRYRSESCREPIVQMYEWSLSSGQAKRLHTILITRHDPLDRSQVFEPDAGGLECCKRVSEFLDRFADGRPAVPERYFWPHELGEHLWTQSPDRVVIFRSDGQNMSYRSSPGSSTPD